MTLEDMKAAATEMKEHVRKANDLASELWEAGCHVEAHLAPIYTAKLFENRLSPQVVSISVFLPM